MNAVRKFELEGDISRPSLTSNEVKVIDKKMHIQSSIWYWIKKAEAGNHYNENALPYLQHQIEANIEFPILDEMKRFIALQGKKI